MKKVGLLIGLLILGLAQPVFAVTVDELKDARIKMFEGKSTTKEVHILTDKVLNEKNSEEDAIYIAHTVKSSAFFLEKKGKEAVMEAQAAIDIKPENMPAYWALSDAYRILGDYDAAFEQCKKSISFIKEGMNLEGGQNIEEAQKKVARYCENQYYTSTAVPPAKIWNTYNENEAAGDEEYGGRTIAIKGKIAKIEKNMSGDYQAVFPIGDMSNVLCVIKGPKDNRSKLLQLSDRLDGKKPPKVQHPAAKLKRGQHVVFKGKVSGFALGNLVIEDCEVVE